ncbi:MAG: adenylate kinase family protein [Candidatus Levyibacteriota bacterium]
MKLILIGIQGSGKSTQGNLLSQKFSIPYLATGQILRDLSKEDTELGAYLQDVMNKGFLISDEKIIEIVSGYLSREEYKNGYILDGFPRTLIQAESFKDIIDYVIYLKVSDEEALKRIETRISKEKRADDTEEAIKKRIELFHEFTEPVLRFYQEKNVLIEVNGEQAIEDIHAAIMKAIGK